MTGDLSYVAHPLPLVWCQGKDRISQFFYLAHVLELSPPFNHFLFVLPPFQPVKKDRVFLGGGGGNLGRIVQQNGERNQIVGCLVHGNANNISHPCILRWVLKGELREEMPVLKRSHQHSSVYPGQPSSALSSDFKGLAPGGCHVALIISGRTCIPRSQPTWAFFATVVPAPLQKPYFPDHVRVVPPT